MGNEFSKQTDSKKPTLLTELNFIATNYILTQNFTDMENLADAKYCDKLVILTSKIIASKLTNLEITYLAQKMRYGKEVNVPEKDSVILLDKSNLDDLDVNRRVKKRRMCIGIAKFYVQIAHLFAAIVKTINPVYTYKINRDGVEIQETVSLRHKDEIPKGAVTSIKANNICDNRMNALLSNSKYSQLDKDDKDTVTINPKFCSINKGQRLTSLPGIPELEALYYDIYDYDRGDIDGPLKKIDPLPDNIEQSIGASSSAADANAADANAADANAADANAADANAADANAADANAADANAAPAALLAPAKNYLDKAEKWYEGATDNVSDKYNKLTDNISDKYNKLTGNVSDEYNKLNIRNAAAGGGKTKRQGFVKMSKRAKEVYAQDLKDFWETLTNGKAIPMENGVSTIQRFSDIRIDDFKDTEDCGSNGKYKKSYTIKKSNALFKDYANNIKTMTDITNEARNKLLAILAKLFARPKTDKKDKADKTANQEVVIHPDLTEKTLKILVDEVRAIIVKLYITCDKYFKDGIKILDSIISKKQFEQTISLTKNLEDTFDYHVSRDNFSSSSDNNTFSDDDRKRDSEDEAAAPEVVAPEAAAPEVVAPEVVAPEVAAAPAAEAAAPAAEAQVAAAAEVVAPVAQVAAEAAQAAAQTAEQTAQGAEEQTAPQTAPQTAQVAQAAAAAAAATRPK
jgi:hypothetical protein